MVTQAQTWVGRNLIGNDGSRLGQITEILEDDDGEEWLGISPAKNPSDLRLLPAGAATARGVKDVVVWLDQAQLAQAPSALDEFAEDEAPEAEGEPEPEPEDEFEVEDEFEAEADYEADFEPEPESEPVVATRRRRGGNNLTDIEGLGPQDAATLVGAGVRNIKALLANAGSAAGRRALAKQTGIGAKTILEWVNRADLMRIKGVGAEFSDLLETAGVDTVKELSKRKAANLQAKMAEVNDELQLVRRAPSLPEVERWVAEAKQLPVMVTY